MIETSPDKQFATALGDINAAYMAFKPPTRISVAEGASKVFKIKRPGEAAVSWSPSKTNYMVEPMNMLASRAHKAVAFVGPSQSGKTAGLGEAWISHVVVHDPGDMLIIQMTEGKAREYSKQRIDRMITHSPELKALLSGSARDDNVQDKGFKHGMWLKIAWPTTTNLSSTSYRYVFITDIDRMSDDLDGEGDAFTLGLARPRTYLSRGKVCVESSPGRALEDPNWKPATKHEGPPTSGIVGIYNRGDRRRWYWQCFDCRDTFEAAPGLSLFNLPPERELLDAVRTSDLVTLAKHHSRVICPHCGSMIDNRHQNELNLKGRWLRDGQIWLPDGQIVGEGMTSDIASFWLGGVAAAYQKWDAMLLKHLQGLHTYAMTGDEGPLQVSTNTDQAMPYLSRHLAEGQGTRKAPNERQEELKQFVVPDNTRSVLVAVDVQGGANSRFVCQAHAVAPNMEQTLINRWEIKKSPTRKGMGEEFAHIDPANYPEDWDALTEQVVRSTYRTSTDGVEIRVKMTVVDSGGEAGATPNAYAWYRRLRKLGLHNRVRLYKGGSVKNAPQIKETMVGARKPGEKGDVPLLLCNTDLLSDGVDAGLKRQEPGPNYIHFPKWLPPAFFDELGAEVRQKNGTWKKIRARNESFDLCRMIRVGMLALGLDKIRDWNKVPDWLKPLDENSERITREERREVQANVQIASIDDEVAPQRPKKTHGALRRRGRGRIAVPSPYVR